jgi:hypothetical protein
MDIHKYKKAKVYLLVDTGSITDTRLRIMHKMLSDPEINLHQLMDCAPQIVASLLALRNEGYHKQIKDEYTYELHDNVFQLAANRVFASYYKNLHLSMTPAESYAGMDHTIKSKEDYFRLAEDYMSVQDPYTLSLLHNLIPMKPALWSCTDMQTNPDAIIATAATLAEHVFVATQRNLVFTVPVPPTVIQLQDKEKTDAFTSRVLEAMHEASR